MPFDLCFNSVIKQRDVDCAMVFIKELFAYPRALGLKMLDVSFDSYETEFLVVDTLMVETLDRIEIEEGDDLRWWIWKTHLWPHRIPNVRNLVMGK